MESLLRFSGVFLILLALIHIGFPRYFRWREDLASLSLINRQMMYVHMFFIALTVFLMGALLLFYPSGLIGTPFGRVVALGFALFWLVRLFFQLFVYAPVLWRGKRFETAVHVTFILFWAALTLLFFFVYFGVGA